MSPTNALETFAKGAGVGPERETMATFLLTLIITILVLAGFILLLNFCRRRLGKTPHGLSGICHRDGGRLCASCAEKMQKNK